MKHLGTVIALTKAAELTAVKDAVHRKIRLILEHIDQPDWSNRDDCEVPKPTRQGT